MAEIHEGIEAATVMQGPCSIGQLARERDRLQWELAAGTAEVPSPAIVGDRLAALEGELRDGGEEEANRPPLAALYTLAS